MKGVVGVGVGLGEWGWRLGNEGFRVGRVWGLGMDAREWRV